MKNGLIALTTRNAINSRIVLDMALITNPLPLPTATTPHRHFVDVLFRVLYFRAPPRREYRPSSPRRDGSYDALSCE
jgi:hypothetical protein